MVARCRSCKHSKEKNGFIVLKDFVKLIIPRDLRMENIFENILENIWETMLLFIQQYGCFRLLF